MREAPSVALCSKRITHFLVPVTFSVARGRGRTGSSPLQNKSLLGVDEQLLTVRNLGVLL